MRPIPLLLFLFLFSGASFGLAGGISPSPEARGHPWTVSALSPAHGPGRTVPSARDDPGRKDRSLRKLWERYVPFAAQPQKDESRQPPASPPENPAAPPENPAAAPGSCVGDSPETRAAAALSPWAWRQYGYELYFASAAELARSIYGLALETGDIGGEMTLDRFQRGAQGFHYGVRQICPWAENLLSGRTPPRTEEERRLLDRLLLEGVIVGRGGKVVPGGNIHHVLGAAKGKKRALTDNLAHERLHVLWDEDEAFREAGLSRWRALSGEEKEAVRASLPGYAPENEAQFVEEWAVREAEKLPAEQREKLIGL
ncbi:MAG: hypothetical protein LBP61_09435 [Desulfovibrio sp.]|jgi:hypothetical protein|nr:hypothetical protein [Desulfovibrio sp.]